MYNTNNDEFIKYIHSSEGKYTNFDGTESNINNMDNSIKKILTPTKSIQVPKAVDNQNRVTSAA